MTTHEQFAKFSNDTAGLERIFRFLQSCVQIVVAYPSVFRTLGRLCTLPKRSALLVLQQRLDLARRYVRVFRFLSVFQQAQRLLMRREHAIAVQEDATGASKSDRKVEGSSPTPSSPSPQRVGKAEEWLDILGLTLTGLYLVIESSTIIDYMQIDGLQVWGPDRYLAINVEAQRFWFLALLCAVLNGLLRIRGLFGANEGPSGAKAQTLGKLVKGVVTNAADIILPGVIVGWLDVSPGVVALVMCATTLSTSMDIWERCGSEISGSK
ncbi:hypothetical protein EV127DRAFT_424606 [Xylaria flabelliformis]|nr:hypothetical protein EV127DRAFT_424606 [Xylaria flabelliformis]